MNPDDADYTPTDILEAEVARLDTYNLTELGRRLDAFLAGEVARMFPDQPTLTLDTAGILRALDDEANRRVNHYRAILRYRAAKEVA